MNASGEVVEAVYCALLKLMMKFQFVALFALYVPAAS